MSPNTLDIKLDISQTNLYVPEVGRKREFLTEIEGEPGNYLLVIDNTATEKIVRCPTAGYFYLVQGREAHAKNAALVFGGSLHDGIEQLYLNNGAEVQDQAINKYFLENPTPPDEYRTPPMACTVMSHYREQLIIRDDYKDETLTDEDGALIERPFELPLGVLLVHHHIQLPKWEKPRYVKEIHVAWAGRIDRVVRNVPFNRIQDHKTTSIGGDQYIQAFQLSSQTMGYVWAARQMWPELDIRGFQLNAIHLKKPTGHGGLMQRGPRGGEPALNFFRANFDYSPERIEEWQQNMLAIIEDFVHDLVRNYFPMYTHHCFNKFGRCPYFDVCTIDQPPVRIRMLNSDAYKDVTWDPTIGR